MKKILTAILLGSALLLTSCEDDVDLTANYKDITIVYGLLDANQDTQYVRIQKAFLGDGDAVLYSSIPDSIYYPSTLQAYLLEYNGATLTDSIPLTRVVDEFNKDSGLFAYNGNVLYKTTQALLATRTYKIMIKKPNGEITTATTTMCRPQTYVYPLNASTILAFESAISGVEPSIEVAWFKLTPANYVCQLTFRFKYNEWLAGDPGNITARSFEYTFPLFLGDNAEHIKNANQNFEKITKTQFYTMIVNNVPKDPAGTPANQERVRKFTGIDFSVTVGSKEFYEYMEINKPSLSFVQKVTNYTNVTNGLGIFGSRTSFEYIGNNNLSTQTKDSLRLGQYTSELNFVP